MDFDLRSFPTTRYQGSKRKILPWIYDNVVGLPFDSVLDACGGSGSVSYLFKRMGKAVTYNDSLKFNSIIGKAIIQNKHVRFTDEDIENLFEWMRQNPHENFIENTFRGIYYLPSENRWLDSINAGIINMNHYHGAELDYKKSLAYYGLFQACLTKRPFNLFHRKNLYIRRDDVERNFGNKTTWEKKFVSQFKVFVKEANDMVFHSNQPCLATNESILDIENVNYDLVYIDPPYLNRDGTNETSNYLKCYHFLEGMADYQNWPWFVDYDSESRRLRLDEVPNLFTKANIMDTYRQIFHKFRNSIIVLSYKRGGVPSITALVELMEEVKGKGNVTTRSMHYQYALNKQNGDAALNREVLIIGI